MKTINLFKCSLKPLFSAWIWLAVVSSTSSFVTAASAQPASNSEANSSKPRVTFFESSSRQDLRFGFENFLSSALDGVTDLSTTDSAKTNPGVLYSSTGLPTSSPGGGGGGGGGGGTTSNVPSSVSFGGSDQ